MLGVYVNVKSMFVLVLRVFLQIVISGRFEGTFITAKHTILLQMQSDLVSSHMNLVFCFKITFFTFYRITFVLVEC